MIQFSLNGDQVEVAEGGSTLLELLRDHFGLISVKDGCSPQGQCGCCTVLVDGEPRVSCVTPARRVADRTVETLEGLDAEVAARWGEVFCAAGASQCGFCTPGIVMRLEGTRRTGRALDDAATVDRALAAHLCRCTGWQTIVEAAASFDDPAAGARGVGVGRDLAAAGRRAGIEGHARQDVSPSVALGHGGFADDLAPRGAKIAVVDSTGTWAVADSMSEARRAGGKVQGRRSTVDAAAPIELPPGDWVVTLQTSWVDPAYLETDASWSLPGSGVAADPLANGGAFGGKVASPLAAEAMHLADAEGTPVRLRWSREDTVRRSPKRPPMAVGVRADGTGVVRVARTAGIAERIRSVAPGIEVEEVDVPGPPTSADLRAAGWAEMAVVRAALAAAVDVAGAEAAAPVEVTSPDGAWASVRIDDAGARVQVRCGEVLDATVLRSYCIGAVHMALGWVTSERLTVEPTGEVVSLTVRSLGIVRPGEMIPVTVEIIDEPERPAVCGSDAVFAATAAAVWLAQGSPGVWPTGRPLHVQA